METAHALIDEHPQIFELDYLQQEMAIEQTRDKAPKARNMRARGKREARRPWLRN